MNQDPQSPLWKETDVKTIGKRAPSSEGASAEPIRADASGFGEKLKRERELRSITLDEIANSTKIGTRMLHALEDEEFSKLPGGIFNKGFVRAYARYLGLDEEQAVVDYLAAEAEQERKRRAPADAEQTKQSQPQLFAIQGGARPDNVYNIRANAEVVEQQPDQAGGFLRAAVILVFVLGIGGFGWKYYNSHAAPAAAAIEPQPTKVAPQAPPQISNTLPDAPSAVASLDKNTELTSQPTAATPQKSADTNLPDSHFATKPIDNTAKPSDALASTAATSTGAVPAEFTLDLRADEDSWAQITADGKQLWSGVVSKDASKSFHASKQIVLKLGNAPGVQLSYNGKALPRFSQDTGSDGSRGSKGSKTRTLTFTPEGLLSR